MRHNRESDSDLSYTHHEHPFTSLPYLKSHICPQFAIFNAGLKLSKAVEQKRMLEQQKTLDQQQQKTLDQQQFEDLVNGSPISSDLDFIMCLYEVWNRAPPEGYKKTESDIYPDLPLLPIMLVMLVMLMILAMMRTMAPTIVPY